MKFTAVAFDLDDTLIDTSGLLVPIASRAAFDAMKALGLEVEFSHFDSIRRTKALSQNHRQIFQDIAHEFGSDENQQKLTQAGIEAFYNPPLPQKIPLLPGAEDLLNDLKSKYQLYLVTSGSTSTQQEKTKRAGVYPLFQHCYFVDGFNKGRKRDAFLDILKKTGSAPEKLLAIGNRLSQEIHDAKEIGARTCYFEYGEHVGEKPRNAFEIPDYTVKSHSEIKAACQL